MVACALGQLHRNVSRPPRCRRYQDHLIAFHFARLFQRNQGRYARWHESQYRWRDFTDFGGECCRDRLILPIAAPANNGHHRIADFEVLDILPYSYDLSDRFYTQIKWRHEIKVGRFTTA